MSVTRRFAGPDARFYTESAFTSAETGDRVLIAEPGHDYVFASEEDVPADGAWLAVDAVAEDLPDPEPAAQIPAEPEG